jgi:tetratricopeptide (TPR) repeat protein
VTSLLLGVLLLVPPAPGAPRASASCQTPGGPEVRPEQVEDDDVDGWIARGRTLLAEGRAEEAEVEFERAHRSASTLRTRMWLLRSWMEQGRINDALDATDELRTAGERGVEVDYLYGMAWFLAAEKKIEQNSGGPSLDRNVLDAFSHLRAATRTDDERFGDALYPLAKMAWMSQRLEVAQSAARRATVRNGDDARAHHLLGRVALSRAEIARAAPDGPEAEAQVGAHEEEARASLERAVVLLDGPEGRLEEALLSETHLQLLRLHLRRGETELAADALAGAVAWDPERIDFEGLQQELAPEAFLSALARGARAVEKRFGKEQRLGLVNWWLGWSQYAMGRYSASERAFLAAISSRRPGTRSAWYYVARVRHAQENPGGAVAALRAYWNVDPAELLSTLESEAAANGPMLDQLGRWCADTERLVDATIVLELHAEVVRQSSAWQRLGRYLADQGTVHLEREGPGSITAARCNATALHAFDRAQRTSPSSPVHMLDLAMHLDTVLGEDRERARELYERARLLAGQRLADPAIDVATRTRMNEIRRVAGENLERLRRNERE